MDLNSWIGISYALLVISGGIIARVKGDYFSRGVSISFITCIFGVLALILAHRSRARMNDEYDMYHWPSTAYIAVFTQIILVFILLFRYWFF